MQISLKKMGMRIWGNFLPLSLHLYQWIFVFPVANYLTSSKSQDCSENVFIYKSSKTVLGTLYMLSSYHYISFTFLTGKALNTKQLTETNKVKNVPIFKKLFLYFPSRLSFG